jgi:hypothetical protein
MRRFWILPVLTLIIASVVACGGDDDQASSPTATRPSTQQATPGPTGFVSTPIASVTPTTLPIAGSLTPVDPIVVAIAAYYAGYSPPVSLTNPLTCQDIYALRETSTKDGRVTLDQQNANHICIGRDSSTFEALSATVDTSYYGVDSGQTLTMENQGGEWRVVSAENYSLEGG